MNEGEGGYRPKRARDEFFDLGGGIDALNAVGTEMVNFDVWVAFDSSFRPPARVVSMETSFMCVDGPTAASDVRAAVLQPSQNPVQVILYSEESPLRAFAMMVYMVRLESPRVPIVVNQTVQNMFGFSTEDLLYYFS